MRERGSAKKVALFGMLVALGFVFGFVEFMLPINLGIPGVKLGLANLVTVVALYTMGPAEAIAVSVVRVMLSGFTFGSISMMLYSLAGALLSFGVMALLKKTGKFGIIGVSTAGGVAHNVGQLLVAAAVLETANTFYYFPVLLAAGVVTGALIGFVSKLILERLKHVK